MKHHPWQQDDDNPAGDFVNIDVADIIKMKNDTLKRELYLQKEKSSGNKPALIAQLIITISKKKPKFTNIQIRVSRGKKKTKEINPNKGLKLIPASAY